jgi:hypothetical protein
MTKISKKPKWQLVEEYIFTHKVDFLKDKFEAVKIFDNKGGIGPGIYKAETSNDIRMISLPNDRNYIGSGGTGKRKATTCRSRMHDHVLNYKFNNRPGQSGNRLRNYMIDNNLDKMRVSMYYWDLSEHSQEDIRDTEKYLIDQHNPFFNKDVA